jgi:hypothetical protein
MSELPPGFGDPPIVTVSPYRESHYLAIAEQDGVGDYAIADTEDEARTRALHRLQERMAKWGFLR